MTELVLRGIFLLRKKEIDWLYQGPGKEQENKTIVNKYEYKRKNINKDT